MSLATLPMGSPASSLGLWLNTTDSDPVGAGGAPGCRLRVLCSRVTTGGWAPAGSRAALPVSSVSLTFPLLQDTRASPAPLFWGVESLESWDGSHLAFSLPPAPEIGVTQLGGKRVSFASRVGDLHRVKSWLLSRSLPAPAQRAFFLR